MKVELRAFMRKLSAGKKKDWSWRLRVVGTVLSLVLLVWLLWKQDWNAILIAIKTLPLWIFIVSFGLLLIRHTWNTTRWFILVRAQDIPIRFPRALRLVFTGLFVSNFLPSMVGGDVVRIAGIIQDSEERIAGAASVVVDRVIGVIGMLFALPFSAPLIHLIFSEGLFLGGILGTTNSKWVDPIRHSIRKSVISLKIWLKQPFSLFLALLASWLGVLSYAIAVLIIAEELGIPVSLTDVVGASTLTYFITMIPISINGYGLRELAILSFYTQFGASSEQATALALVTRFLFLLVSLPGSLWVGEVLHRDHTQDAAYGKDNQ
jgi:uncharacterized membrane protein YbhN (UPF0104 family)